MMTEEERKRLAQEEELKRANAVSNVTDVFKNELNHQRELEGIETAKADAVLSKLKARAQPSWDKALKTAYDMYANPQHGYENIAAIYSKVVAMYAEIIGALYMKLPVVLTMAYNAGSAIQKTVSPYMKAAPGLKFDVDLDENNVLDIKALARTDGKEVSQDLYEAFQHVMLTWLMHNGCKPNPGNVGGFVKRDGQELTAADFAAMKPTFPDYFDEYRDQMSKICGISARPM